MAVTAAILGLLGALWMLVLLVWTVGGSVVSMRGFVDPISVEVALVVLLIVVSLAVTILLVVGAVGVLRRREGGSKALVIGCVGAAVWAVISLVVGFLPWVHLGVFMWLSSVALVALTLLTVVFAMVTLALAAAPPTKRWLGYSVDF